MDKGNIEPPVKKERVAGESSNLTHTQQQARDYREKGLQFQQQGDYSSALSFYQKAVELDPTYCVAYNDLGVLYEASGQSSRAEECYLKAVQIDPTYLSGYTNLALYYETKRDFDQAAKYWKKRADLGSPNDPWAKKAQQRYTDITLSLSARPLEDLKEKEALDMVRQVGAEKDLLQKDNKELAKSYFEKAKRNFQKGDDVTAFKQAVDAIQLDPDNDEIEQFVEKIQTRLLSK